MGIGVGGRKGEKGKAACLSRQVFAIATETCGIGKCDAAARQGKREEKKEGKKKFCRFSR